MAIWLLTLASLLGAFRPEVAERPVYFFQGLDILPSTIPFTQERVLHILLPEYQKKLAESKKALLKGERDAWWNTYEAAVVSFRRTNLGIPGEDFLIVVISEQETPCQNCRYSTFGGVDLKRGVSIGSFRPGESGFADMKSIRLVKKGPPWRIIFRDVFGPPVRKCTIVTEWPTRLQQQNGAFQLAFAYSLRSVEGKCDAP